MPTAIKNQGSVTIFSLLLFSIVLTGMIYLAQIILAQSVSNQVRMLADNAAKCGAALITTRGKLFAIHTSSKILANFPDKNIKVTYSWPYRYLTVSLKYSVPFSNKKYNITTTASSFARRIYHFPRIGAFLIP